MSVRNRTAAPAPVRNGVEPPMTPAEIAALTGLHYQTVLAEIRAGRLRAKLIGGHYLIRRESYDAWLDPGDPPPAPVRHLRPVDARPLSPAGGGAGSVASLDAIERGGQLS